MTVGQRRGLAPGRDGRPRYALAVDVGQATVTVGSADDLLDGRTEVGGVVWADRPVTGPVLAQCSAHGTPVVATIAWSDPAGSAVTVRWAEPQRRVAPGQSIVFYDGDEVLGGGIVAA